MQKKGSQHPNSDELVGRFREYLLGEAFKVGDRLPGELELAQRFGVGRSRIRDVLSHFSSLGLVDRVKNRGTVLTAPEDGRLRDEIAFCFQMGHYCPQELREARLCLEIALLPLAIQRISPADIQKLQENLQLQEKSVAGKGDPEAFDEADRQFHLLLLAATRNNALAIFANILSQAFRKQFRTRFLNRQNNIRTLAVHRAIFQAVLDKDLPRARTLLRKHILES